LLLAGLTACAWLARAKEAPASFGEYFVSPAGSEGNDGSESSPWPSVNIALEKVGGGNIITMLPGVYTEQITVERSGPAGFPTTIRSQRKWEALILGGPAHGIYTSEGVTNVVIDGVQVSHAGIDGIKVGSYATVRNCWIHHSARQGISAHRTRETTVEYCLIERNGTDPVLDHGIYISGTNDVVRCNVIRWNKTYGCQIYYDPPASSAECQFYNNLVYGNKDALTVWSPGGQTNYVFNNTLVSTNYVLIADHGNLCLTNNILVGSKWGRSIWRVHGAKVWADYNLSAAPGDVHGRHDVVAADPGFINPGAGLFWLSPGSPARGRARASMAPPVDFYGDGGPKITDLGAFQYSAADTSGSRFLQSIVVKNDYWPDCDSAALEP
jgi:hypothetical protein